MSLFTYETHLRGLARVGPTERGRGLKFVRAWGTCSQPVHPRFDHIFALPVGVLPAQAPTGAARRKSERAILGRTATWLRTDHPENPRTEGVRGLFGVQGFRCSGVQVFGFRRVGVQGFGVRGF